MNIDKKLIQLKKGGKKELELEDSIFNKVLNHMYLNGFNVDFNCKQVKYLNICLKRKD